MRMAFSVILVELDRCARGRARWHGLVKVAVLGTLTLVVLAQLVFVVGLFWPQREGCGRTRRAVRSDVMSVVKAVEQFRIFHPDRCPRDLGELVTARIWARPQGDPFGRPFTITCSAAGMRVCSQGRDEFDPGDDVCSDDDPMAR
jgi:hypothetical protein